MTEVTVWLLISLGSLGSGTASSGSGGVLPTTVLAQFATAQACNKLLTKIQGGLSKRPPLVCEEATVTVYSNTNPNWR